MGQLDKQAFDLLRQQHAESTNKLVNDLENHIRECQELLRSLNVQRHRRVWLEQVLEQDKADLEFYRAHLEDLAKTSQWVEGDERPITDGMT